MSSPTNVDFDDTIPPPKPDAYNIEWQATAPIPDPNSPGNQIRELSGCYRTPQAGGVLVLTDVYDLGGPDAGWTFVCNSASPFTITHPAVIPVLPNPEGLWNFKLINLGAGTVTLDLNGLNLDGSGTNPTYATGEGAEISTDGTDLYTCLSSGTGGGGGGSGTVTSVGLSTDASFLTVGSSPVTTAGTITLNKTAALTGNQVVATPDGTTGKADLRALVAADIPNLPASKITTGQLALARGGTGVDLSASGGTTAVLAQDASHVISARALVAADIPNIAESQVTSLVSDLALKAPLASPALTGTPTAPTAAGGTNTTQIATTAFVQAAVSGTVVVIGFVINNGAAGTNVGPMLQAPRAGTVSKCVIVTKASDGTTGLTFLIKKNGTNVFSSNPSVAAGTASGTTSSSSALTSSPLSVAAGDVFQIDITSGSPNWEFTAQLET